MYYFKYNYLYASNLNYLRKKFRLQRSNYYKILLKYLSIKDMIVKIRVNIINLITLMKKRNREIPVNRL